MPAAAPASRANNHMPLIEINADPSSRDLRWFGLLLPAFFAVIAAIVWWRTGGGGNTPAVLLGAGAALSALYYAIPSVRRPLFVGWMYLGWPIGAVVSFVLLAVVYYLVVTPIGLLVRLFSHDPLHRAFDSRSKSYWNVRPPPPPSSRYFRQY